MTADKRPIESGDEFRVPPAQLSKNEEKQSGKLSKEQFCTAAMVTTSTTSMGRLSESKSTQTSSQTTPPKKNYIEIIAEAINMIRGVAQELNVNEAKDFENLINAMQGFSKEFSKITESKIENIEKLKQQTQEIQSLGVSETFLFTDLAPISVLTAEQEQLQRNLDMTTSETFKSTKTVAKTTTNDLNGFISILDTISNQLKNLKHSGNNTEVLVELINVLQHLKGEMQKFNAGIGIQQSVQSRGAQEVQQVDAKKETETTVKNISNEIQQQITQQFLKIFLGIFAAGFIVFSLASGNFALAAIMVMSLVMNYAGVTQDIAGAIKQRLISDGMSSQQAEKVANIISSVVVAVSEAVFSFGAGAIQDVAKGAENILARALKTGTMMGVSALGSSGFVQDLLTMIPAKGAKGKEIEEILGAVIGALVAIVAMAGAAKVSAGEEGGFNISKMFKNKALGEKLGRLLQTGGQVLATVGGIAAGGAQIAQGVYTVKAAEKEKEIGLYKSLLVMITQVFNIIGRSEEQTQKSEETNIKNISQWGNPTEFLTDVRAWAQAITQVAMRQ